MKQFQIRQGDVMLEKIKILPANIKPVNAENGRLIIARGEVTGHCHAVEERAGNMFVGEDGRIFLSVEHDTEIVHEEHGTIELPEGIYVYTPQREYTPEAVRNVAD